MIKVLLTTFMIFSIENAFAQVVSGVATVEKSPYSDWATFQVHGAVAKELYTLMRVPIQMGVKRSTGITCAQKNNNSYYCSMSVSSAGEVEGDGISKPQN